MFNSYDMSALGAYLKNIRNGLNFTQADVASKAKMNIETLRRIENGKVTPKYETIETLSLVYREDLMSIFSMFRSSKTLFEFYEKIDQAILSNSEESMIRLDNSLKELVENPIDSKLIHINELTQLKYFVQGIRLYRENDFENSYDEL